MPSFRKRHGRWEIRFKKTNRKPKEKSESLPANTSRTEIKRIEGEMNNAYYGGDWDPWIQTWQQFKAGEPIGTYSVEQAKKDFIRHCKRNNRWNSESTIRNNTEQLGWFCDYVGNKQVSQITNDHLAGFLERKDVRPGTAKTYYRNIKAFINWLKEQGYNDHEFYYRPAKHRNYSILHFTEAELEQLIETFRKNRTHHSMDYVDIWRLMFYQCMRAKEVFHPHKDGSFGIRPVDITGNRIRIYGKGEKVREVPLVGPIRDMVLERKSEAKHPTDHLFNIVSYQGCFSRLKDFVKIGFPEHRHCLNLHSLRRGGGIYWTQQGKPLAAIKELLGHASIKTTERHYARFQPDGMMSVFG